MATSVRGQAAPRSEQRSASGLRIQVFADGADRETMLRLYRERQIDGFTTNPTLMRKAGVTDYEGFARSLLFEIPDLPYAMDALEPVLSRETVEYHYGAHHLGYVEKLNGLVQGTRLERSPLEQIIRTSTGVPSFRFSVTSTLAIARLTTSRT